MSRSRSQAFERALKIELLRTRTALERETIGVHVDRFKQSLDPRHLIGQLLPQSTSGVIGQVSQVAQLALRYPYLLSSGASLVASQIKHPRRLVMIGATALLVWAAGKYRRKTD